MRLNTSHEGLEGLMGPLEAAIMEVLWQIPNTPVNIAWVLKHLEYDKEVAYTTVATTLNRMAAQGMILATRTPSFAGSQKERCLYRTLTTREDYLAKTTRGLMEYIIENPELSPAFHEWLGMYISTPYHA